MIACGETKVAFIPVIYDSTIRLETTESTKSKPMKRNLKLEVLSALHSAIKMCSVPLQSILAKCVEVRTRQRYSAPLHFTIAFIIAVIADAKDLLGVNRRNWTLPPCHTCFIR